MLFNTSTFVLGSSAAGVNLGDILFTVLAFSILLYLLRKFAWGPLMKIMVDRENYIAKEIETAEKNQAEAKKLVEEQREALKSARLESQKQLEQARKLAEVQKDEIMATARKEAENIKEVAKADIIREKEKAMQELKDQVSALSVLIASKVIEKELNVEDQTKLIHQYIQEAGDNR